MSPNLRDIRTRLFAHRMASARLASLQQLADQRGCRVHVVGGAVRDALCGIDVADFDLAIPPEALDLIAPWAGAHHGTCVPLYEELPTRRVVFPDRMTADVVQLRAPTIEQDLALRDFTVNAIAIELRDLLRAADVPLLDPCGGIPDLHEGRLRCAGDHSLADDPLRILRAFRFMATRGLRISEATRQRIVALAPRLRDVSSERVRDELSHLLGAHRAYPALRALDDTGVLDVVLPELRQMRGATQNAYHHLDVWLHTLSAIDQFEHDPVPQCLMGAENTAHAYISATVGQRMTGDAIMKFALLFHDVGKPTTQSVDATGQVHFIGHEKVGADLVREVAVRLKTSRRVRDTLSDLVANHLMTMHLAAAEELSPRALRRFLRHTGEHWIAVLMLSWADLQASRGPARSNAHFERTAAVMAAIADQHLADEAFDAKPGPLITGDDVLEVCRISPGPEVGVILEQVENARLDGSITTRRDALSLLHQLARPADPAH